MRLYFLTRSTTDKALLTRAFDSSSVAYEVNLIEAMRSKISVNVVNIGGSTNKCEKKISLSSSYISTGLGRMRSIIGAFRLVLQSRSNEIRPCVLTTGYYPLEMAALLLLRAMGFRVFSIIFDSHIPSLKKYSWLKKKLVDGYFRLGLYCSGFLTGILVVNAAAKDCFPVHPRRVLLTRIGSLFGNGAVRKRQIENPNKRPRFLFAGTLNSDNGVNITLEAISSSPELDADFLFFGDGDAEKQIKKAAKIDSRVKVLGRVVDETLDGELSYANFLICLRDPNSISAKYAFPSKLIKFMGSGTPVIANNFPGVSEAMADCLLTVDDYSARAVAKCMREVLHKDFSEFSARAIEYVEKWHDWSVITDEIVFFLRSETCN